MSQGRLAHHREKTFEQMTTITDYIVKKKRELEIQVDTLNDLRTMMTTLKSIREREAGIEMEIQPILDMYTLLQEFNSFSLEPEEASSLYKLRGNWKDLVDTAEKISDMLGVTQTGFKKTLITDV